MAHHSFTKTVRNMARDGWRREYASEQEAKQDLGKQGIGVAEACLLEFLRRLDLILKTLLDDHKEEEAKKEDRDQDTLPSNAGVFPGCKVGDFLYYCDDLQSGIKRSLILFLDAENHAKVIDCDYAGSSPWKTRSHWAADWHYPTEAQALLKQAMQDAAYYVPRLLQAQQVMAAVKAGNDLTAFRDGLPDPDEEPDQPVSSA